MQYIWNKMRRQSPSEEAVLLRNPLLHQSVAGIEEKHCNRKKTGIEIDPEQSFVSHPLGHMMQDDQQCEKAAESYSNGTIGGIEKTIRAFGRNQQQNKRNQGNQTVQYSCHILTIQQKSRRYFPDELHS